MDLTGLTPESFPKSKKITESRWCIYDVRDAIPSRLHEYGELAEVLKAEIEHFTVESLANNEFNPHVTFRFNFKNEQDSYRGKIQCCLLSMEAQINPKTGDLGPGAARIKLCSYTSMTHSARAGFQFKVLKPLTLADVIGVVRGRAKGLPTNMKGDLSSFHFGEIMQADNASAFVGCRDWVYVYSLPTNYPFSAFISHSILSNRRI